MSFTLADAETILHMADVCYGEGIGPDNHDLLLRIRQQYPDLAESYRHVYGSTDPMLNTQTGHGSECLCSECLWKAIELIQSAPAKAMVHDQAGAYPRVITRVMDDGLSTKDGAA